MREAIEKTIDIDEILKSKMGRKVHSPRRSQSFPLGKPSSYGDGMVDGMCALLENHP